MRCFDWYTACEEVDMEAGGKNNRTTYVDLLVKAADLDLLCDSFCSVFLKNKIH